MHNCAKNVSAQYDGSLGVRETSSRESTMIDGQQRLLSFPTLRWFAVLITIPVPVANARSH